MTDTVIKGTGNSRSLKSVPNLATLAPTYEDLLALLTGEGLPVDIGGLNEAGVQTQGTALTKANLLTDALCSALGIAATSTPNQAMDKLRQLVATAQSTAESKCWIENGTYIGNGKYGDSNKNTLTFSKAPELVFVQRNNYDEGLIFLKYASKAGYLGFSTAASTVTWWQNMNIISWYADSASKQCNSASYTYYYFAIG